jgi:hypothetical protein
MPTFLASHPIWVPILVSIVLLLTLLLRADRGEFLFKKRTEVVGRDKVIYYTFHTLKYIVVTWAVINLLARLYHGQF